MVEGEVDDGVMSGRADKRWSRSADSARDLSGLCLRLLSISISLLVSTTATSLPISSAMALLASHLEQIALSSSAIYDLPFPPPKIFTNALLRSHDITALIRDTESHERALFSIDPSAKPLKFSQRRATRRGTVCPAEADESLAGRSYSARNNRNQSAVARVLGAGMMEEIKRSGGTSARPPRGEINVEVLLRGAEILCNA